MITCWSFGHGSWCSLSSPFYIFLIDGIALLVSWLWFFVFIVVTFFFILFSWYRLVGLLVVVPNVHRHHLFLLFLLVMVTLLISWFWFLTFITIAFLYVFPNHDHFVGLSVMFINVKPSYMFFMIVIMLLFFWLWFLTFIVITVLHNCDHLFGLLVAVLNIHCHRHYLLIYSS